jgi:hypothetical protein
LRHAPSRYASCSRRLLRRGRVLWPRLNLQNVVKEAFAIIGSVSARYHGRSLPAKNESIMAGATVSPRTFQPATSNSRAVGVRLVNQLRASRSQPGVFRITAYCNDAGGALKVVNLGSWPCQPYDASVERLLADRRFLTALEHRLSSKGFAPSTCESIYAGLRNATPTRVFPRVLP